jgi:hypothetical protein
MGKIGKIPLRLAADWPTCGVGAERVVLCPWLRRPDLVASFWLSVLSWHDANAALLAALQKAVPTAENVFVAVFCADPFRRPQTLFAALRRAGVVGIANLPSVSFLDGAFAATLEQSQLGTRREIEFLRLARQQGFRVIGCAAALDNADALADAGAEVIVAHAGPPLPDRDDNDQGFALKVRRRLNGRGIEVTSLGGLLASLQVAPER